MLRVITKRHPVGYILRPSSKRQVRSDCGDGAKRVTEICVKYTEGQYELRDEIHDNTKEETDGRIRTTLSP